MPLIFWVLSFLPTTALCVVQVLLSRMGDCSRTMFSRICLWIAIVVAAVVAIVLDVIANSEIDAQAAIVWCLIPIYSATAAAVVPGMAWAGREIGRSYWEYAIGLRRRGSVVEEKT